MAPFRLGLAGTGRMVRNHMRAISESDKVRVVAVAEPSPSARTSLEPTGLTLHASLETMLDAGGLDGVLKDMVRINV